MDLIAILQTIRRHLLIVVPMALLTLAALGLLLASRSADFTSDTNVVLLTPPSPPIDSGGNYVARTDRGSTDNPLTRFSNSATVVEVVARAISTPEAREQLEAEGADPRYEVVPADTGPIGQITATADSAEGAVTTVQIVADAFVAKLAEIQAARGIDPTYAITTLPVDKPSTPSGSYFSTVRLAVGVIGVGVVATFFAVSVAEAVRQNRRRDEEEPDEAGPAANGSSARLPTPEWTAQGSPPDPAATLPGLSELTKPTPDTRPPLPRPAPAAKPKSPSDKAAKPRTNPR